MTHCMKKDQPSLAARAIASVVKDWGSFRDGEYISANINLIGLNAIDQGSFCSIIEGLPGQIIKVFDSKDIGYQFMLEQIKHHNSIHLPVIYSISNSGRYIIVEMEKLIHNVKRAVTISNIIDGLKYYPKKKSSLGFEFDSLIRKMDHQAINYHAPVSWDNHEGNIMFRDKVPVLIDMFYYEDK